MIKYLYVLVFIVVYFAFDTSLGYSHTSEWYTHFTYMFGHLSILHLILNSIAFISIFRILNKYINTLHLSITIIFIGVAASLFSVQEMPTVGASAMIYGMFGGHITHTLLRKSIVTHNKQQFSIFVGSVLFMIAIGFTQTSINAYAHLYGFIFGLIIFGLHAILGNKKERNKPLFR